MHPPLIPPPTGLATLQVYEEQKLFQKAEAMAPYFESSLHALKGLPNVIDIRNYGLMGAVEFTTIPGISPSLIYMHTHSSMFNYN